MTTFHSSSSVSMMNNTPSGAKKHRKSSEPESHQTFWFGTFAPAHCPLLSLQPIAFFSTFEVSRGGLNYLLKNYGFLCDAMFFFMRTDHLEMKLLLRNIRNTVGVQGVFEESLVWSMMDDSIKQFSIQLHPKDMKGASCVLNCLAYHPYLVSMLFADLLSLHLITVLMFPFILVMTCAQ